MTPASLEVSTTQRVLDVIEADVPAGARVLVASDLHLQAGRPSEGAEELAKALEQAAAPGLVILAGDVLELLAGDPREPREILRFHDSFVSGVRIFGEGEGRRVVYLVGNHDGRLAWDSAAADQVAEALGCEICFTVDLKFHTGAGLRRVRVEHGNRFDPANAFVDPRDPLDSPLGSHVVRELLPALRAPGKEWLADVQHLGDPLAFPTFVASRLAYRRIARHLMWLALPFLLAVLLKLPLTLALLDESGIGSRVAPWPHRLLLLLGVLVADLVLVAGALVLAARQAGEVVAGDVLRQRGQGQNDVPRQEALALLQAGYTGLISGHTHHAELKPLGQGFYGNTGCCIESVEQHPARLGLPPVFLAVQVTSWIEIEAGADLHVRLLQRRQDRRGPMLEWLLARRREQLPELTVVASLPEGDGWPPPEDGVLSLRRYRFLAALAIAGAGLVNLASAATPPLNERLERLRAFVPLAVPQAAAALVAVAGLGLLLLARGIRKGHRTAWTIAQGLLVGSAALHLAKGIDFEEAAAALLVVGYLLRHRSAFSSPAAPRALRSSVAAIVGGVAVCVVVATAGVELMSGPGRRLPLTEVFWAVAGRLVGVTSTPLPDRADAFLMPVLAAVGLAVVCVAGWAAFRPLVPRAHPGGSGLPRARVIVDRYGGDTLAYFALRGDKQLFFYKDSVVAYSVVGGVCLVSPDPIGPAWEQYDAWAAFHVFAGRQGWPVVVLAGAAEWLPIYRRSGMHELYIGDEAIVDCQSFSLDGGQYKKLRQAVARVAREGYSVEFFDPSRLEPELEQQLRQLATESRRGDVERGFSMTLGRLFDPADGGLLLAVAFGPDGRTAGFCQFVPATGIGGYSLDVMRRRTGEQPNGLMDFILVETIRHLNELGMRGLGLNFAVMRRVVAGEDDGIVEGLERSLLRRMSRSMQIESLWRFNAKYNPDWRPRYLVYEAAGDLPAAAFAIAKAESVWELPLVGRFLMPDVRQAEAVRGPISPQ